VKTLILGLLSLFVVSVFTPRHNFRAQSRNDEELIKNAYRAYVQAWKAKDLAALKDLISPDYMAVNFEGTLSSKEIELVIAENDNEWTAMTVDEIWTRVWQDAAIASGFISAQGKTPDGKPVNARVRFLAMLVKRDGRWQLVATQSALVKKP
jgi:uncharacterized protein (TIGR02246 family)